MKKSLKYILVFICFLIICTVISSVIYLKNANYYGKLLISYNAKYSGQINFLGISPLGNLLTLESNKNTLFYKYNRFYKKAIIRLTTASADSIKINVFLNDNHLVKVSVPPGVIYQDFSFKNSIHQPFIEKLGYLASFVYNIKWLKSGFTAFLILSIALNLILFRAKIKHFIYKVIQRINIINIQLIVFKKRILINLLLFSILFIISLLTIHFSKKFDNFLNFDNYVHINDNPDQADYQTIAVNFAENNLFMVNGMINNDVDYNIYVDNAGDSIINKLNFNAVHFYKGLVCLHRFPGYPLLLGLIYKITGVCPLLIKFLQLFLLLMVVFCFPLLGYELWNIRGFWAGVITAPFFLFLIIPLTSSFSPDLVTIVINFFITWAYMRYRKTFNMSNGVVLGLLCGFSFLIKSSLMFFILFMFLDLLIIIFRERNIIKFRQLIIIGSVFIICWLPYNLWGINILKETKRSAGLLIETIKNKPDLVQLNQNINQGFYGGIIKQKISGITDRDIIQFKDTIYQEVETTGSPSMFLLNIYRPKSLYLAYFEMILQHSDLFFMIMILPEKEGLYCHNEYIKDGMYSDAWIKDSKSFYNNDRMNDKKTSLRILNFYTHNPGKIFTLSFQKLKKIFDQIYSIRLFDFLFVNLLFCFFIFSTNKKKPSYMFGSITCFSFSLILLFWGDINVVVFPLIVTFSYLFKRVRLVIPIQFIFIILNILIIPILMVGVSRYACYYIFPVFLCSGYFFLCLLNLIINIIKIRNDIPFFSE